LALVKLALLIAGLQDFCDQLIFEWNVKRQRNLLCKVPAISRLK